MTCQSWITFFFETPCTVKFGFRNILLKIIPNILGHVEIAWMFEDGCFFYTLANFYREQSNLKGIFFELKCSYRRFRNGSRQPLFLYYTSVMTVARACSVKSPRNKRQTHTIKLGKYIFKI